MLEIYYEVFSADWAVGDDDGFPFPIKDYFDDRTIRHRKFDTLEEARAYAKTLFKARDEWTARIEIRKVESFEKIL